MEKFEQERKIEGKYETEKMNSGKEKKKYNDKGTGKESTERRFERTSWRRETRKKCDICEYHATRCREEKGGGYSLNQKWLWWCLWERERVWKQPELVMKSCW